MTTQAPRRLELPRPAVMGIASGIFFLTFFGAFWGFLGMAFMSGIHFLPLARLFHVPAYYITGTLLSVLGLVAVAALLLGLQIAGPSPQNWSAFVGIGATLILWLTVLYIARLGLRVMRMARYGSGS